MSAPSGHISSSRNFVVAGLFKLYIFFESPPDIMAIGGSNATICSNLPAWQTLRQTRRLPCGGLNDGSAVCLASSLPFTLFNTTVRRTIVSLERENKWYTGCVCLNSLPCLDR